MLAAEPKSSAAHRADLAEQVLEHLDVGKLPLDAIADSDFLITAADDRYPAWHPDTYPFEAIAKPCSLPNYGALASHGCIER